MPRSPATYDSAAAGSRLRRAIRQAMLSRNIPSIHALASASSISYGLLYDWFAGSVTPSTQSLARLGEVLGVPAAELLAAYEGRESLPSTVLDALNAQTREMAALNSKLDELLSEVGRLLPLAARGVSEGVAEAAEALRDAERRGGSPRAPRRRTPHR